MGYKTGAKFKGRETPALSNSLSSPLLRTEDTPWSNFPFLLLDEQGEKAGSVLEGLASMDRKPASGGSVQSAVPTFKLSPFGAQEKGVFFFFKTPLLYAG